MKKPEFEQWTGGGHMKGKKHSPKKVSLIVETEATFQGDNAPLKAAASVKRDFQHKLWVTYSAHQQSANLRPSSP
jgi:hypothetical protein